MGKLKYRPISNDSKTCTSREGRPRKEFLSENAAADAADAAWHTYGNKMVSYRCDQCGKWHLSPAERSTPNTWCECCSKAAYETKEDAQKRAKIQRSETGIALNVYKCDGSGWHLTKQ